jgi:hypothetical protein
MANTRLIQQAFDEKHYRRIEKVLGNIHSAYLSAIKEAVTLAGGVNFDPSKPFSFKDYPATKRRVDNMINELAGTVNFEVKKGMKDAWLFSALKNDKTIETALDISKFTKSQQARYFGRNLEALDAFTRRKEGGLNLSDKIWNLTGKFKTELEMGIDSSLLRGESAAVMSRNIRGYLKNPDNLFRRVRNDRGALHLSKRAKELKPGKGVYRSSYKNAMRVTRTEINMSYREADYERWKQLDFIVGIEIRLTNSPKHVVDICDDLKGKYPKEFKFRGWHPQCMCHALAILATPAEREAMTDKILEGESPSDIVSDNAVKDVTAGMKDWIKNNAGRETNSQPYWIKDNFEGGTLSGGLKPSITKRVPGRSISNNVSTNETEPINIGKINTMTFKSKEEADEYLLQSIDAIDTSKMSLEQKGEVYPILKARLENYNHGLKKITTLSNKESAFAESVYGEELRLGKMFFDKEKFNKKWLKGTKDKWFHEMTSSTPTESMITHELGHVLTQVDQIKNTELWKDLTALEAKYSSSLESFAAKEIKALDDWELMRPLKKDGSGKFLWSGSEYDVWRKEFIKRDRAILPKQRQFPDLVSVYSGSSESEFIAEAFSLSFEVGCTNKYALEVRRLIDAKYLKK